MDLITQDDLTVPQKIKSNPDWPDLEDPLLKFHQISDKRSRTTPGDRLKKMANELWNNLPQYRGQEEPRWSNEWLAIR